MDEIEDKETFVNELNHLLVTCGGGRYDHLREIPLTYVTIVNPLTEQVTNEFVVQGGNTVNVTGDSLSAMLSDLNKAGVL